MSEPTPAGRRAGRGARRAVTVATAGVLLVLLAVPAPATPPRPAPPDPARSGQTVTVMTRNLYLGASLTPLFGQPGPDELVAAATKVWADVGATDYPARAAALAAEIADARPDLVGLQEVSLYRSSPFGDPGAERVEIDFLAVLRRELAALGQGYRVAVVAEGFDGALPVRTPDGLRELRLTDRDVILVRPRRGMRVTNPQAGTFEAALQLPLLPGEQLAIDRAWTSVDVRLRGGARFRFINTHLEAFDAPTTLAQAEELLDGPAATKLPVIAAGDFNSGPQPPDDEAYHLLTTTGGFTDADPRLTPTCCFDDLLADPDAELTTHIDLVLHRGPFTVAGLTVVGTTPFQVRPPLWPSDHAGVVATLRVRR